MSWPTPEQKFEMHWKFLEPEIRKMFYEIFKEGVVYAVSAREKQKARKGTLGVDRTDIGK